MPQPPSGRFVLRIDPGLHGALRAAADAAGTSLNDFCARKLAAPVVVEGPGGEAVAKASGLVGRSLVGVVAFGSWARDELSQRSDVDLLVVVDADLTIARDLYRRWDDAPLRWDGRPVEPHFVHLPADSSGRTSGLWAEVAVDGVVLFERGLEVSRWLASVRSRIAQGSLVRRWVHGHPYWVEAA